MKLSTKAMVVCAFAAASLSARQAEATTACSSLPSPIIISGSSAVKTYIGYLSSAMSQQTTPQTLIYSAPGSCSGVAELLADVDPTVACGDSSQPGACATGTGTYYTAPTTAGGAPVSNSCTFDTMGDHVDLAVSDVFMDTCTMDMSPTGFTDTNGPVEAMTFVVPAAATGQQAITAQEGYFVFGFPNADGIMSSTTPWNNPANIFVRAPTSGTEIILGGEIGVASSFFPTGTADLASSGAVAAAVAAATGANVASTIGILGIDYVEENTGAFTPLAFQAFHQVGAYWPNSTPTAHDKQNVRDGHYTPWGYAHFITRNGATSGMATANGQAVINLVNGTTTETGFSPIDSAVSAHFVPQCAMTVSRPGDYPALASYADPAPCDCYYESKATGTAPTSCTACTESSGCSGSNPVCRLGFCEPR